MTTIRTSLWALLASGAIVAGILAAPQVHTQESDGTRQGPGAWRTEGHFANRAEARLTHLTEALNLSEEQAAQIRTLLVERRAELRPMTPGERPDAAARAERATLGREMHDQVLSVLTPEQQATYRSLSERARGPWGGPAAGMRGGGDGPRSPSFRGAPRP